MFDELPDDFNDVVRSGGGGDGDNFNNALWNTLFPPSPPPQPLSPPTAKEVFVSGPVSTAVWVVTENGGDHHNIVMLGDEHIAYRNFELEHFDDRPQGHCIAKYGPAFSSEDRYNINTLQLIYKCANELDQCLDLYLERTFDDDKKTIAGRASRAGPDDSELLKLQQSAPLLSAKNNVRVHSVDQRGVESWFSCMYRLVDRFIEVLRTTSPQPPPPSNSQLLINGLRILWLFIFGFIHDDGADGGRIPIQIDEELSTMTVDLLNPDLCLTRQTLQHVVDSLNNEVLGRFIPEYLFPHQPELIPNEIKSALTIEDVDNLRATYTKRLRKSRLDAAGVKEWLYSMMMPTTGDDTPPISALVSIMNHIEILGFELYVIFRMFTKYDQHKQQRYSLYDIQTGSQLAIDDTEKAVPLETLKQIFAPFLNDFDERSIIGKRINIAAPSPGEERVVIKTVVVPERQCFGSGGGVNQRNAIMYFGDAHAVNIGLLLQDMRDRGLIAGFETQHASQRCNVNLRHKYVKCEEGISRSIRMQDTPFPWKGLKCVTLPHLLFNGKINLVTAALTPAQQKAVTRFSKYDIRKQSDEMRIIEDYIHTHTSSAEFKDSIVNGFGGRHSIDGDARAHGAVRAKIREIIDVNHHLWAIILTKHYRFTDDDLFTTTLTDIQHFLEYAVTICECNEINVFRGMEMEDVRDILFYLAGIFRRETGEIDDGDDD